MISLDVSSPKPKRAGVAKVGDSSRSVAFFITENEAQTALHILTVVTESQVSLSPEEKLYRMRLIEKLKMAFL